MTNKIQPILKKCNYPTDIVVLDWETFYTSNYKLGNKKLSTIEYIFHEQFTPLGLAYYEKSCGFQYITPEELPEYYTVIKNWCDNYTITAHNLFFDGLVIKKMFGITPKYGIDTLGLSHYFEARARHSLDECAKRHGLQPKGDLEFVKGKHWEDLTPDEQVQLIKYAKNDVGITIKLFKILFPMLPRPEIELPIMQDLLERVWNPQLKFDFEKAGELKNKMENEINRKLLEINWL